MADKPRLDRIDHVIVGELSKDARLTNKELAARVGLAPSSCLERVRRLRVAGVLRAFRAEVDPGALGIGLQAMVAVRLRVHGADAFDAFTEHLRELPEVVAAYHVAGAIDFLIHIAVRDADHLRDVTWVGLTRRPEVAHLETSLIFEVQRSAGLPDYAAPD